MLKKTSLIKLVLFDKNEIFMIISNDGDGLKW